MKCPYINPTIKECEKCPFADCVANNVSYQERIQQSNFDMEIRSDKPKQPRKIDKVGNRTRNRRYYDRNQNKEVERVKEYNQEHVEERNKYYKSYRQANLEKERARDRERYQRKKREKEAVI